MSSFPSDLLFALFPWDPSWCSTALYSGQRPEDVRMRNAGHASLVAHLRIYRVSAADRQTMRDPLGVHGQDAQVDWEWHVSRLSSIGRLPDAARRSFPSMPPVVDGHWIPRERRWPPFIRNMGGTCTRSVDEAVQCV
jgi:hypothetical protein